MEGGDGAVARGDVEGSTDASFSFMARFMRDLTVGLEKPFRLLAGEHGEPAEGGGDEEQVVSRFGVLGLDSTRSGSSSCSSLAGEDGLVVGVGLPVGVGGDREETGASRLGVFGFNGVKG